MPNNQHLAATYQNIDGIIAAMKPHLKPEEMETRKLSV